MGSSKGRCAPEEVVFDQLEELVGHEGSLGAHHDGHVVDQENCGQAPDLGERVGGGVLEECVGESVGVEWAGPGSGVGCEEE
jgi:hypothetical protein